MNAGVCPRFDLGRKLQGEPVRVAGQPSRPGPAGTIPTHSRFPIAYGRAWFCW